MRTQWWTGLTERVNTHLEILRAILMYIVVRKVSKVIVQSGTDMINPV